MLEAAGVPFECISVNVDEDAEKERLRRQSVGARGLAEALAVLKAQSAHSADLVLGSDQTLELDNGSMLDKPSSRADAFNQLKLLSGRTHMLHSAGAIIEGGELAWQHTESVTLTMRLLGDDFLNDYLDREYEAIRCSVGGYRIEGLGIQLFDSIEGSHFAILGLPLLPLLAFLRQRGVLPS
jgi:septum formation protein